MRIRIFILAAVCALIGFGAAAPAFAEDDWYHDDWHHEDWRRHDRQEWREHEWRDHEQREHEWRHHEAFDREQRERQRWEFRQAPPIMVVPGYGAYPPPPGYYGNPAYVR